MFGRTSFAIVAALGALLLAAPASADNWGADRYHDDEVTAMLDAREQALLAKQVAPATPVAVSRSTEIEWPQIGVGLALGLLLGAGLMLTVRITTVRGPVAR